MGTSISSKPFGRNFLPGRTAAPDPAPANDPRQLDAAYQRGRRDESLRRRRSPVLGFIGFLAFVVVALFCYEAAQTGSFSNAGAFIDQHVTSASQGVQAPIKKAENNAGTVLGRAGQDLKRAGGGGQ
jgi:hypothetical protein